MFRIIFFVASFFLALVPAGIIFTHSSNDIELTIIEFAQSEDNCLELCLMGIYPGSTTIGEVMPILREHAWVTDPVVSAPGTGYGQIIWSWSGHQPAFVDPLVEGRITFFWENRDPNAPQLTDVVVQTVSIQSTIRMFHLQQWFGVPQSGTGTRQTDNTLFYSIRYHQQEGSIIVSTIIPCPANLTSYWNAFGRVSVSIERSTNNYVLPIDMVNMC